MSWIDVFKPSAAVAALMIASVGTAASAATLVVRSSGPSAKAYPAGKQLADNSQIALRAGDQVVILDSKGTRTLKGPGTFSPTVSSNQASDSRETFAQVSSRRARPGATRGVTPPPAPTAVRNPNIWFVDVERSATVCVADPTAITMWRANGGEATSATLTDAGSGKSEVVQWSIGQSQKPWPASLPVTEGARYKVSWQGQNAQSELRFALMGANTAGLEDMASKLITKGCDAQLDLLIETVAIPDSPAS
ncbi:hypothetical protein SAMN06295912_101142 [Sphingomonas laterariae]|uniref:Secreted protein n=2 Tax=Edaphosphingomonas laterariae TaxID=861865 RepID=A0A239BHQ3_9SPHN|nr:hypothetical protein SAMN06295912_101142 [Sphingomonas laterariae]